MARALLPILLVSLLLAGCTGDAPQVQTAATATIMARAPIATAEPTATLPASATPAEKPSPSATVEVEPPSATSDDPILAACPVEEQSLPFRDDLGLDVASFALDLCYDLEFALDDDGDSFEASARVTVRNGSNALWPDLLFRLYPESPLLFGGDYEVDEVRVDGAEVNSRRVLDDDTGLRVTLPAPLAPGDSALVEIAFEADLAEEIGGNAGVYGIFARTEVAATIVSWFPLLAVWDEEAGNWYDVPVLGEGDAVYAESALIRGTLSAPDRFDLAVSGLILDEESAGGRTTYQVVTGPARDLAMVWMEGYRQETIEVDGTTVRNWFRPGHETGAGLAFEAAHQSLALFNNYFGDFPFEEVEVVEVPLSGAGGVEYPQLFLLGEELYTNANSHTFLAFASAHEMAHQWWYSTVGSDINAAPWQDEALTNWSAVLWLEQAQGDEVARETLNSYRQAVERYEATQGEEAISQPLDQFQGRSNAYGTIVYLKGALFFQAVREEIGDDDFFDALTDYHLAHRFGLAPPESLLDSFEERSGEELDALFKAWGVAP